MRHHAVLERLERVLMMLLPLTFGLAHAADEAPSVAVAEDAVQSSAAEGARAPAIHVAFQRAGST